MVKYFLCLNEQSVQAIKAEENVIAQYKSYLQEKGIDLSKLEPKSRQYIPKGVPRDGLYSFIAEVLNYPEKYYIFIEPIPQKEIEYLNEITAKTEHPHKEIVIPEEILESNRKYEFRYPWTYEIINI